ncbi:TPA: GNAT family N-acetyltransferase, partial [Vibrio vulnificus]|nr:GNAT family N-acetyltransferase [Vibrio vulnificus]
YQFYLSQGFTVVSEQRDEHTGHPEYTMNSGT